MSDKHTPEQLEAIQGRNCSILVSAAAGSGKTSVLIGRILGRIFDPLDPVNVDELLVVTFSKAAAAEMRERLQKELGRIKSGPGVARAKAQMIRLPKSTITTIHSFCLEVIKENFHLLDLDPGFRIADDGIEMEMLKEDVLEKLFDEIYEEMYLPEGKTPRAYALSRVLDSYGGNRNDTEVRNIILKIHRQCMNEADPVGWLNRAPGIWREEHKGEGCFARSPLGEKVLEIAENTLTEYRDRMSDALELIRGDEGLTGYEKPFLDDLGFLERSLEAVLRGEWDEIVEVLQSHAFDRLGTAKKTADEETKDYVKGIRDQLKKELTKLIKGFFYSKSEELFQELHEIEERMEELMLLTKLFREAFLREKKRLGVIDFNDMEHLALELFHDEANGVARKYGTRFREIYIDEYQDSNRVQETILNGVSRRNWETPEENLFMVGDLKQSIYGFRKADPTLFKEKLKTFRKEKGAANRLIVLNRNFRSRREIIHGVNGIMGALMCEKTGDITYSGDEALDFGAVYYGEHEKIKPGIEIRLIDKGETPENREEDAESIECEAVVRSIREMVDQAYPIWDGEKGQFRPAHYRDFAVLMRSVKGFDTYLEEEFVRAGVPYFMESSEGYFDTFEISLIVSLLKILDNPRQDIPLLAVLRSPIGGLEDGDLVDLRGLDPRDCFYDLLLKSGEYAEFLDTLEKWRIAATLLPADQLLWKLYEETGLYNFVGALPKGKQRQGNLRFLYEKAAMYEKTVFRGLFNFVKYLEKQIEKEATSEKAKLSGLGQDVVQVMSVHKSKGLEYPVVILANCGKKFNRMDARSSVLVHSSLGLGPEVCNIETGLKYSSILKESIIYEMNRESLSEEMRILYVAMTRAKEKLIIFGTGKDLLTKISAYSMCVDTQKVPAYLSLGGDSFLDWILMYLGTRAGLLDGREIENVRFVPVNIPETRGESELVTNSEIKKQSVRPEIVAGVAQVLEYNYAHIEDTKRPKKISVTGLKKKTLDENDTLGMIEFPTNKSPRSDVFRMKPRHRTEHGPHRGAELGTLIHFIMQRIDFHMVPERDVLESWITDLLKKGIITENEGASIERDWILKFLKSEICQRIRRSSEVRREGTFKLMIPAREAGILSDGEDGEILLQGIVDCMFFEDGKWVLLDYKTDYIENGDTTELERNYGIQLDWYSRAIERSTGVPVKEKNLYFMRK